MSDQIPDRDSQAERNPVRRWTGSLLLVLLGVATVAWLFVLAWAAIWFPRLAVVEMSRGQHMTMLAG